MTDKKISNFELITLNYFLIRAFLICIVFNTIVKHLKQDCWTVPLLSLIPGILFILVINEIFKFKPNLNISEKICNIFNKNIAKTILFTLFVLIYLSTLLNLLNVSNFIQSQYLNKTPLIIIYIMIMLTSFYILTKGINAIARTSNFLFYISILLVIFSFVGLLPAIKLENIKPYFTSSTSDYFSGINTFFTFNIIPMFMISCIPKSTIKNEKIKKALIISYILAIVSLFLIIFQTIGTFGYELTQLYEYPAFFALKHVSLVNLSTRTESILITHLIFDMLIYNVFSIYFMQSIINSSYNIKNRNVACFIICILVLLCTFTLSSHNLYIYKNISSIASFIINIIFSFFIFIFYLKIKMRK